MNLLHLPSRIKNHFAFLQLLEMGKKYIHVYNNCVMNYIHRCSNYYYCISLSVLHMGMETVLEPDCVHLQVGLTCSSSVAPTMISVHVTAWVSYQDTFCFHLRKNRPQ